MTKLHYKNLTDRQIKNRLRAWYQLATPAQHVEGMHWYSHDAGAFVRTTAAQYGLPAYTVAAVLSALSPSIQWERNKLDAIATIEYYQSGVTDPDALTVCTYGANKLKALGMLYSGDAISVKARKTHNFALNCAGLSTRHVVIDRWHYRACTALPSAGKVLCHEQGTKAQYARLERLTIELADELGLEPCQLQAIVWVTIRANWK